MAAVAVKLDPNLHQTLARQDVNCGTVIELRDAYMEMAELGRDIDRKKVRTWLYGQLRRLVTLGLLRKKNAPNSRFTTYLKTKAFDQTSVRINGKLVSNEMVGSNEHLMGTQDQVLEQVRARSKQYQVDLIACAGGSEEYMRLLEDYPALRSKLEPRYHLARERSTKRLGQLKAIESALMEWTLP